MSAEQARQADAAVNGYVTAQRRADDALTALIVDVAKRSVTSPVLHYWGAEMGWMALGRVKGHRQRHPWMRGHGRTARAALIDLDQQIAAFRRGERGGEQ